MSLKKLIVPLILVALFVVMIPVTTWIVSQRQELRKSASTPTGVVTVRLDPSVASAALGSNFAPVAIKINPQGTSFSSLQVYVIFSYSGNTPPLSVIDDDSSSPGQQIQNSLSSLTVLTNTVTVNQTAKTVTIGFAGYFNPQSLPGGFTSSSEVTIATIHFLAAAAVNQQTVSFDPTLSKIIAKGGQYDAQDVLLTPGNTGSFTVTSSAPTASPTPSATPTATPTASPTPSSTPTATPSPSQTPTPTPSQTATPTAAPANPAPTPKPTLPDSGVTETTLLLTILGVGLLGLGVLLAPK